MQNSAPRTSPSHAAQGNPSGSKPRGLKPSGLKPQDAWIASIVNSGAWRAKTRSMPLLWLLIASAFVFPMGLWSSLDQASQADETPADPIPSTPASTGDAHGGDLSNELPALPDAPVTATTPTDTPQPPINSNPTNPAQATVARSATQRLKITVIVSGQKRSGQVLVPRGATIKQAVEALHLKINSHDRVTPAASSRAYNGARIRITRIRYVLKTHTISSQPQVRYQLTTALHPGASKTIQSGQSGATQLSERVWFKDGAVAGREKLAGKVVRPTKDEIVMTGARARYLPGKVPYHNRYARAYVNASRSGSPRDRIASQQTNSLRRVRSIELVATGYSPDPRENGGSTRTATGLPIGYGAAAVDPSVIPLGTRLYVEGYGYAFACDTGGAIRGHRIDLAYDSYGEANSKGRKKVRVWILAP